MIQSTCATDLLGAVLGACVMLSPNNHCIFLLKITCCLLFLCPLHNVGEQDIGAQVQKKPGCVLLLRLSELE